MSCERVFVLKLTGDLLRAGLDDDSVAAATGLPRRLVNAQRRHGDVSDRARPWRPPDPPGYAHLLGLYLGDGHLTSPQRGSPYLRLTMDANYPRLVETARNAVARSFPAANVRVFDRRSRAQVVQASSRHMLEAFPQHGRGPKHKRRIALSEWQLAITEAYPEQLVRGLLESDGSRSVNRVQVTARDGRCKTYEYARWFFSNSSADIRAIFCRHCDQLDIRWTESSWRNVSIARRDGVAMLDAIVEPKA